MLHAPIDARLLFLDELRNAEIRIKKIQKHLASNSKKL
jgi:hypothetical protein